MRTTRTVAVASLALLAVVATAAAPNGTTTRSATRPVVSLLLGTYRGTVVDDDERVHCVTTFATQGSDLVGDYVVREGAERYAGKLDRFTLISDERRECRFRWRDKHGEGLVTVVVAADGSSFAGSWGLEVVQERLVWRGQRAALPSTSPGLKPPGR